MKSCLKIPYELYIFCLYLHAKKHFYFYFPQLSGQRTQGQSSLTPRRNWDLSKATGWMERTRSLRVYFIWLWTSHCYFYNILDIYPTFIHLLLLPQTHKGKLSIYREKTLEKKLSILLPLWVVASASVRYVARPWYWKVLESGTHLGSIQILIVWRYFPKHLWQQAFSWTYIISPVLLSDFHITHSRKIVVSVSCVDGQAANMEFSSFHSSRTHWGSLPSSRKGILSHHRPARSISDMRFSWSKDLISLIL